MNQIDLKEHVREAIRSSWPEFAQSHPHLAAVIDEDLLVESASSNLSADPEYQQSMRQAELAGTLAQGAAEIISEFIARWLKRLI